MWFSAGIVPQYLNYLATKRAFNAVGIMDDKWLVVIAMGMAAMNIILLRNSFEGVPSEIEEAAIVDGASEMQVLSLGNKISSLYSTACFPLIDAEIV